jgi:hypothetical protein
LTVNGSVADAELAVTPVTVTDAVAVTVAVVHEDEPTAS